MTAEQIQAIEDRGAQIAKGMQELGFKGQRRNNTADESHDR